MPYTYNQFYEVIFAFLVQAEDNNSEQQKKAMPYYIMDFEAADANRQWPGPESLNQPHEKRDASTNHRNLNII